MGRQPNAQSGGAASLWLLFLANALVLLGICTSFIPAGAFEEARAASWMLAVWLTYPLLYLGPAYALAALVGWLTRPFPSFGAAASLTLGCLLFGAVQLAVLADQRVLALYGFHLNGFVWNLITTRGGIAAMGAGPETFWTLGVLAAAVLLAEGIVAWGLSRVARRSRLAGRLASRRFALALLAVALLLTGYERIAFGVSHVDGYRRVLASEQAFPLYLRTSFDNTAARMGFRIARDDGPAFDIGRAGLVYPLRPPVFRPDAPRLNVVVLAAESLRADGLSAENMPATWAFAQQSLRFTHHVSAGNGTRMGVFGLFYGLPGPYWFRLLGVRRGPVLLSALKQRGYDLRAYTADDFSYPEFADTVFSDLDPSQRTELGSKAPSWQRDRDMVEKITEYLDTRDPAQPFFLYAFFESPHARYDFPPETARYQPYLESFDYVRMNLERDIEKIHNRYRNSVLHLDTQYARVFEALKARHLLDSTVVVVTGDHGEEFMENGRWGHNSAFSEAQIRVPLVLRVPGRAAAVVDRFTSHLDVPATLLDALGVTTPPTDYSLGHSLLGDEPRDYALVSDWLHVAYVDAQGKVVFPTSIASFDSREVSDRNDRRIANPTAYLSARGGNFAQALRDVARFTVQR